MFLLNPSLTLLLSFLTLSFHARAQLAGQTVLLKTVLTGGADGGPGNCLTATKNADGAAVVLQDCGTNATQLNSWTLPSGAGAVGTVQIFGNKCLDVTNGVNADGTRLQIWTCAAGNTSQMWLYAGNDDKIAWSGTNKCVDLTDGNTANGNQIQIWDCNVPANDNQKWVNTAVTQPKSRTIALKADPSHCVTASSNAVGAPVVIGDCDPGVPAQTFFDSNGRSQLMIYDNLCVAPQGDNALSDGVKLVLETCSGSAAQQWQQASTISTFNNGAFGKVCMDLTNGNKTSGNQLQLWSCAQFDGLSDNANQDWLQTLFY